MTGVGIPCWNGRGVILLAKGWTLIGLNVSLVEPSAVHKTNRVVCFELYAHGVWLEDDSMVVIHWLRRKRSPTSLAIVMLGGIQL